MKIAATPHQHVSGPHASDYYLLLDEQSDCIFALRFATQIQEAHGVLPEIWIDESEQVIWYVWQRQ